MSLSTTDLSNGVFVSSSNGDNTKVKFTNAGVYNIQFSAQLSNSDNSTQDVVVWIRKNGTNIEDSSGTVGVPPFKAGSNGQVIASWNYYLSLSANDYVQMCWHVEQANVITLETIAAGTSPTHPRTPSLILTAQRVDTFLSNTGSFQGSFSGSFSGSLFGTASNATTASYVTGSIFTNGNPALSASYALTASFALNAGGATINTGSLLTTASFNSYTGSSTSQFSGTASYALTASYAMNAGGATIDTGSLLTTASFNSYTSSNTSQFAGTSSYALTASYIPTLQQVTTAGTSSTNPITVTVGEEYYPTNGISSYSQGGVGVRGESSDNYGVSGISNSTGVYGEGGSTGVYAYSPGGVGLEVYGGLTSINVAGYIGRGLVLTSYGVPVGNSIEIIDADTVNLTVNQQGELTATKVTATSFTGSLFGTASWAVSSSRASSSSYALTASFALNAGGATVNTGSLVTTASFNSYTGSTTSQFAGTASFAQSSSNFVIANTLRLDNTLTDYKTSTSTTSETLNLFQQATGSYTSAFVKYSILNGTNARAGEFVTVWNGTTVVNYDNSTTDIGNTAAVTFNSSIVSSQIQINAVVSAGWTVKALATFI
jgi:hypothetical protein